MRNVLNKKLLAFVVTALCVTSFLGSCYLGIKQKLQFEFSKTDAGYVIDKYTGDNTIINLANARFWKGEKIVKIGDNAFKDNESISEVILPDGISIGNSAFENCDKLTKVEYVEPADKGEGEVFADVSVGDAAFLGCSRLSTFNYRPSLKSIGANAFSQCISLQSFKLRSNITTVGSKAFDGSLMAAIYVQSETLPAGYAADFAGDRPAYFGVYDPYTYTSGNTVFEYVVSEVVGSVAKSTVTRFVGTDSGSVIEIPVSIDGNASPVDEQIVFTQIGAYAFAYSSEYFIFHTSFSIRRLDLPGSVDATSLEASTRLETVGDKAFEGMNQYMEYGELKTRKPEVYVYTTNTTTFYDNWNENFTSITYSKDEPADTNNYYWHLVDGRKTVYDK